MQYLEDLDNRRQEALRNGDPFDEEEREFPTGETGDYLSSQEKFVVCLDTMGQDREFTGDERRFVLRTVQTYKKIWEAEQRDNLTRDRDERLALSRGESIAQKDDDEEEEKVKPDVMAELEKAIEEKMTQMEEAEPMDDETKDGRTKQMRL